MEQKLEWRDGAGNEIQVGDLICYAALWSRSATLKWGRVTALRERRDSFNEDKVTPTIQAATVDHWGDRWRLQKDGRPVTLGELERMIVVRRSQVPQPALELLDSVRDSR